MYVAIEKNPRRRRRKWPWVLLVLFLLSTLPIGILYFMLYDPNTKNVTLQSNFSMQEYGNRVLVDSVDNTKETEKISMIVTENDMDNVLHHLLNKLPAVTTVVKKAYCVIKGDSYKFYLDLDGRIIKSRLYVETIIKDDIENNRFVFAIKDITLGNIHGLKKVTHWMIQNLVSESMINNILSSTGVGVQFSVAESALVYNKASLVKDMSKLAGAKDIGFFMKIIEAMIQENILQFDSTTDNFMESTVDLKKLKTNEYVTDTPEQVTIAESDIGPKIRDKMVTLVNAGAWTDKNNLKLLFDYFFNGWTKLNDDQKAIISATNMSSIGINSQAEKEALVPLNVVDPSADLTNKMKNMINVEKLLKRDSELLPGEDNKSICSLSEHDINAYIKGRNVVGYSSLLHRQADESYKINFISMDNFYTNIYQGDKQTAEFVGKINVNGYHTSLTFSSTVHDSIENNKLNFKVDQVKYGTMGAESLKKELFSIIEGALAGGDKSIAVDLNNYTMSFDFNAVLTEAKKQIKDGLAAKGKVYTDDQIDEIFEGDVIISTYGSSREDADGGIKLALDKSISAIIGLA